MLRSHLNPRPWTAAAPALRIALAASAAAALLPASAAAATLGVDQRCFVPGESATLEGSGFAPRASLTLTRAGELLPAVLADNSGFARTKVTVPPVASGLVESQVELTATDGTSTAKALLNIATVGASFSPTTGDPRTLRVSHVISGFGLSETKPSIYLHYVSPAAQRAAMRTVTGATAARAATKAPAATTPASTTPVATTPAKTNGSSTKSGGGSAAAVPPADPPGVRTVRLGQLRGACGVLHTSPRRLFPFKVTAGKWLLQYDTRAHYTHGTTTSPFLWVSRPVTVAD